VPRLDRLAAVVAVTLAGITLSFSARLPSWRASLPFAFSLEITDTAAFAVLSTLVVCLGMDSLVRSHPEMKNAPHARTLPFCFLPALLTVGSLFYLHLLPGTFAQALGLAVVGLLLTMAVAGEYMTIVPPGPRYGPARYALDLVVLLTAFINFSTIYSTKARSMYTATAVTVVAALLALETLRYRETGSRRGLLYAGVIGLALGEATWALNYWAITGLVGGLFLLAIFYVLTGLSQCHLRGRLTRGILAEFLLVGALAFGLLAAFPVWLR